MKIIIIGPGHPFRGGISDFNEVLATELLKEGHEVEILSFKKQYPKLLFPGKTQVRTHAPGHELIIHSKIHGFSPFNWPKVNKWLKKQKADLYIVRYWTPFMSPSLSGILNGIKKQAPVIAITDNIIPHEKKFYDTYLTKKFLRNISAALTLSKSVRDDLVRFSPHLPLAVSPHPIYNHFGPALSKNDARKKLNIGDQDKVVLFFGLVRAYKGLDLLLKALLDNRLKEKNIKLLLAGEFYDKKESYKKELSTLEKQGRLIPLEYFIPDAEIPAIFCAADLVTQTYHTATQSGVTQIAYHYEKPMLVTKVGGLPEMVPDGKSGYVVETKPSDIADKINHFFEEAPDFQTGIATEKKKYSWDTFITELMKLYETVK